MKPGHNNFVPPEGGASFWDFSRCLIGWHAWAEPKETDLAVTRSVTYGGFERKYGTAHVGCTRLECKARRVFDTHIDIPHEDLSLYQPTKKMPDAEDPRCQAGEHEFDDQPTESIGSGVERQNGRCQRPGCGHGFMRFRARVLIAGKLGYSDWVDNPYKFLPDDVLRRPLQDQDR